jgi:hypothetical protein
MDILMYEGNLDVEELLDWFRDLDKYFDYEDIEEDKKVKHFVTRLKGIQHCGGMNCRLIGVAKENKELKSRIGWSPI